MRDNAGMTLQVLRKRVTRSGPPKNNPPSQMILIIQTAAFPHNATPGDNQGANLSRKQSV